MATCAPGRSPARSFRSTAPTDARAGVDVDVPSRWCADGLRPAPCAGAAGRRPSRAKGLKPAGAFELEFFLLANERDGNGRIQPARAVLDGLASAKTEVYSVDHLHGMEPLFSDIYAAAKAQGIPAETVISEYAPGQYELTLNYRNDMLRAADDLLMLKRLVRLQARRHGVTACFMAKPIEDYAGSGMHLHVSMQDEAGRNVFTEEEEGAWSDDDPPRARRACRHDGRIDARLRPARQFLAALRLAILCAGRTDMGRQQPLGRAANSGRAKSAAASNTALRASTPIPIWSPRPSSPASPRAWTSGSIPARRRSETAMRTKRTAAPPCRADWLAAIEAAEGSAFLKSALGAGDAPHLCAIKRAEYLRVARTVSELDYHLYLHEV